MNPVKKTAKTAGIYYLLMGLSGPIGLLIVPSKIIIPGDTAATIQNLISNEFLYRTGIVTNIICQISFVFLVLTLYRLFSEVNIRYARLMVSLVLVAVPVAFFNIIIQATPLLILNSSGYLKVFSKDQLHGLVMFLFEIQNLGVNIAGIFWGLWLFPFGYLVIKSRFIPKIFGILLILGCLAYLTDSLTLLLIPRHKDIIANILMIPLSAGEISTMFWLLIKGIKDPKKI